MSLGDAVNGDSDRCGGNNTRDTQDRRVGNSGRRRGTAIDRHARGGRVHIVVGHGDRTRLGQQATVDDGGFARADCAVGHQRAHEGATSTDITGTDDLPEDVLGLRPVDQMNGGVRTEPERSFDLEDEHSIGVALTINGERRGRSRGDGSNAGVHARSEGLAADVADHRSSSRTAFGVRVSSLEVGVCVCESRCEERCSKMAVANKRVGRRTGIATERGAAGARERRIRCQRTE